MSEIRANNIISETGLGAVGFSSGLTVGTGVTIGASSGIVTATKFSGDGSNLTGLPAGQLAGALPAIDGSSLTGVGVGADDSINTSGIVTATAFVPSVGQLGHRNMVINGAMQVAQRGTVTSVLNSSYGGPDRWRAFRADAPGVWQISRQESAPTGSGFSHCLEHKVTTANGTLDAGDEACITYSFEGQDLAQICKGTSSAKEVTLSFWCRTGTSGTYIAELYDTDNNRQVSKSFTHAGSDGWEKKEITFPADTTGTFTHDNNESLALRIWIAAGTPWTSGTLSTTWTSPTDANRAVGCVNLSATLNNYFRMTGVQLEVGSVATPFEHRSYADELLRCQRYFEVYYMNAGTGGLTGLQSNGSNHENSYQFKVQKRAHPTGALMGNASWATATPNLFTSPTECGFHNGSSWFQLSDGSQDASLSFSAEL